MNEINVHIIDFKNTKVKETVTINEDGSYSIFLNSRFSQEQQNNAYIHALSHIARMDFENHISADLIEAEAHKYKKAL